MERSLHERDRVGVQDSVLLDDFRSEVSFLENLRKRFKENIIYTYIGHVLISVNPYKNIDIYGPDTIAVYQKSHLIENPPHIFAITETAFRALVEEHEDQCILISGESGSGKTEASKKVLEYIAAVSDQNSEAQSVKDKLLYSNPVLEAFGNAKTAKNDNSSRFGKYMDIEFNEMAEPVGGNIINYLLEKSRVVDQAKGERNFHIFYQLLAGADDDLLATLYLKRLPGYYKYISNSENDTIEGVNDARQMKEVCKAMNTLGLSAREQGEIMAIVASVLHLGNIGISDNNGKAILNNNFHVSCSAELLGCMVEDLEKALTQKTISAKGESVISSLDCETAIYARDALAKAIYGRLFSWMVLRFNQSLQPTEKQSNNFIGILDIYGFEIFQRNSFEQFCINYCNEKLQQLFIELTLKSEQEEYLKEKIEWEPVEFFNNNIIINLIEEKYKGIISILDDECLRPGDTSDKTFLEKMCEQLYNHNHFICHKKADNQMRKKMKKEEEFTMVHYAGNVIYNVHGFLDKNNDLLFRDLRLVMSNTTNSIIKVVFPKSELVSKKRPDTAITQFKSSLNLLMNTLNTKHPNYIRCIKPNDYKKPGLFSGDIISHQVKYMGLMENLRVRRAGFAYRRHYADFLKRYKCLCKQTWPYYKGSSKEGVDTLLKSQGYTLKEYRMGETKIFIRYAQTLFDIEDAFQLKKHDLAAKIQSQWKGYVQRKQYQRMKEAAVMVEKWIRRYLAQVQAERRRRAVQTIRNFIKGFMTRSGPVSDLNKRFIQTTKVQYLLRLSNSLPDSLLDDSWPKAPVVCQEASDHLRKMHRNWLARKYRMSLNPERKHQLEMKIFAEKLFKDKKKSYEQSFPQPFIDDRLTDAQNSMKKSFISSEAMAGDKILYGCNVVKFDRHGYKRRNRLLFYSQQHLYILTEGEKRFKIKHKIPLESISKYEVTSERDSFLLIRLPSHLTKDKGDIILEVPFLIEALTQLFYMTNSSHLLNINSISNGKISHSFSDGKELTIDLTLGANGPGISKGKSGQLMIVG